MKEFVINGNNFNDMDSFYCEIDKIFTKDINFKTGHNLNAFNDLLRGGFGMHDYEEAILIKWINYEKSKKDLGIENILLILEIILDCNNTGHNCKLELY